MSHTLLEALELTTATVELHTGNGARSQPDWPKDAHGNIDYAEVAKIGRSALSRIYTTQRNAHGNMIVCRGEVPRNSYAIIYTGTYDDCQAVKFGLVKP